MSPCKQTSKTKEHPLKDFRVFLQLVWSHLNLPAPDPVQYDIANKLQSKYKRFVVIEAFRGCGKSWITSAFACWVLLLDPQKKILVVSASKSRSDAFSIFVKNLIRDMPLLQHLYPSREQRQSNLEFDVRPAVPAHSASVTSRGILGQITGARADIIIADDIETPANSYSQTMREKIETAVEEFGAVMVPNARIIYLGTPQVEDSLYATLPDKGFIVYRYPVFYPPAEYLSKYDDVADFIKDAVTENPEIEGTSVYPSRFTPEFIAEQKLIYRPSGFALQFMLDTSLTDADRSPLKARDFITCSLNTEEAPEKLLHSHDPQKRISTLHTATMKGDGFYAPAFQSENYMPYTGSLLAIDPSGRGTDETAWCITKFLNSKIFLIALGGYSEGGYSPENLQFLANTAKTHKVNSVLIEDNFGDGMFTELLKPYLKSTHPCSIEPGVKQSAQKELRIIDSIEPLLTQHRVVLNSSIPQEEEPLPKDKQFIYQLTRLTKTRQCLKNDDRIDVFSIACKYWIDQISVSQEDSLKLMREAQLKKELDAFSENILGHTTPPNSFIQHLPHLTAGTL